MVVAIIVIILIVVIYKGTLKKDEQGTSTTEGMQENNNSRLISDKASYKNAVHGELESYDSYFGEAAFLVVGKQKASIGMFQRTFRIGFNRAARIMDELESEGVVGPEQGTKPREILMSEEELPALMEAISNCPIRENIANNNGRELLEENLIEKPYVPPTLELLNSGKSKTFSKKQLMEYAEKIEGGFKLHGHNANVTDVNIGTRFVSCEVFYEGLIPYKTIGEINKSIEIACSAEVIFESVINKPNTLIFRIKENYPEEICFKKLLLFGEKQEGLVIGSDGLESFVGFDYKNDGHLLIGGTTGSGKTSFLDLIMMNIIYRFSPSEAKAVLIDTTGIQLVTYNAVPHLIIPVVTDIKKVVGALYWLKNEIKDRLAVLANHGVKSLTQYEEHQKEKDTVMPRIFVLIDDVGDILLNEPEAEEVLNDVIRNGRAAGVHLVVATQKPTVGAVGTFVKSNISARVAFRTASIKDSQIILDAPGAESITENETFLYRKPGEKELITGYAGHSDLNEIKKVVDYLRDNN